MIYAMIFKIQPQKVAEINKAMMRMMGLDQVEKAILLTNPIQRLPGCMADSKEFGIRNVSTSLPVSRLHSSCYYCSRVLISLLFWGGESNEMKVWVLFLRFKLA